MRAVKKITPEFIKSAYHKVRGFYAASSHGFPAHSMIVIGVTGTKGKTSTANYIWSVLHAGGFKAGLISTAIFRVGGSSQINSFHMTMPDPFLIQRKLKEMQNSGIEVAVVEMTSEGMKQHRHTGIPVDIAVFTNLTPEHLSSHKGSFEEYKKAKAPLFAALDHEPRVLAGRSVAPTIIANADSEHAEYYLGFKAQRRITFGLEHGNVVATQILTGKRETSFTAENMHLHLAIPGIFNIYNALPAVIIGKLLDVPENKIEEGLHTLTVIPGRMETIDEGQNFMVIVDYAHEPASLGALLHAAKGMKDPEGKVILLTGVIGGGRESRIELTKVAARESDCLIITNEDPYEEDPTVLIERQAQTAEAEGKVRGVDLFPILDRKLGIQTALSQAQVGDIVLISGKGAEQTMMVKGGAIAWNEREIVRELLKEHLKAKSS